MAKRVNSGERVGTNPLIKNRTVINDVLRATYGYLGGNYGGAHGDIHRTFREHCRIQVKNISGGDLAAGKILQLGAFRLSSLANDYLWFEGDTPAAPAAGARACILLNPIPDAGMGEATVAGVCIASVNLTSLLHTHANPKHASHDLVSGFGGSFELLSPASETGVQKMAVRFASIRGYVRIKGNTVGAVTAADATFFIDGISPMQGEDPRDDPEDGDEQIEVRNNLLEYANDDAYCEAVYDASTDEWSCNTLNSTCPPPPS